MNIEVWEIPEKTVAYVENIGPYKGDSELFGRMFDDLGVWADSKGLWTESSEFLAYHAKDPAVTPAEEQVLNICLEVSSDTEVTDPVSLQKIGGGLHAVGKFELATPEAYEEAWKSMFEGFIAESEYEFDPRGCFEVYKNEAGKSGGAIVEICVPVKSLGMF